MEIMPEENLSERAAYRSKISRITDKELRGEISHLFDLLLESIKQRTFFSCWKLDCCIEEYMARFNQRKIRRIGQSPRAA